MNLRLVLSAVATVLVAAVTAACLMSRPYAAATAALPAVENWGLHFSKDGQKPIGNASAQSLQQHDALYMADTEERKIYLTFDAGYENGYTAQILDVLQKHKVSACFFIVGHYIESAPELVCRMVSEGHLVGNHTYSHPDMGKIADRQRFAEQLQRLEKAYQDLIGEPMSKLYRPPQGKYSTANLAQAKEMGYTTLFWSLAYVDWYTDKQPSRETALQKLVPRIHPGAVVLLHSTSATNAAVLDELLTKWESLGYTFGDVRELMA